MNLLWNLSFAVVRLSLFDLIHMTRGRPVEQSHDIALGLGKLLYCVVTFENLWFHFTLSVFFSSSDSPNTDVYRIVQFNCALHLQKIIQ